MANAPANHRERDPGVVMRPLLGVGLLTRLRPALEVTETDEPIRAELFSVERLEQHAGTLAAAQHVRPNPRAGRSLARRVEDNGRSLLRCYRVLAEGPPIGSTTDSGGIDGGTGGGLGGESAFGR